MTLVGQAPLYYGNFFGQRFHSQGQLTNNRQPNGPQTFLVTPAGQAGVSINFGDAVSRPAVTTLDGLVISIRSGDLTREEGIALVKKYDGEFPSRWSDEIFKYLSINKKEYPQISKLFEQPIFDLNYYNLLADNFRSPHLWKKTNKNWI